MADNVAITAGSGTNVAAAEATYSGDTTKIQLAYPVSIGGSEGSRILNEPNNPDNFISGKTAAITDTTRTAVIAAQGASVRIYLTHIAVMNSHASVSTWVKIEDGVTEIYNGYAAAGGGGFSYTLPTPLKGTANTALNVSCVTTGANVQASASGYKGA